jgi:ectoine hydroxylase-related dioxygenase (phytanoyl-CoA dioxygenase family)
MMLTQQQRSFYEQNGYLLVEGQFTAEEAGAFRAEAHALIERLSQHADINPTWGSARQIAEGTKLFHCHNVQFYSAAFTRLLVDERLTGAAADLIGSPNVQLHHNKLFIKPPERGSPFPMHQDYPWKKAACGSYRGVTSGARSNITQRVVSTCLSINTRSN